MTVPETVAQRVRGRLRLLSTSDRTSTSVPLGDWSWVVSPRSDSTSVHVPGTTPSLASPPGGSRPSFPSAPDVGEWKCGACALRRSRDE